MSFKYIWVHTDQYATLIKYSSLFGLDLQTARYRSMARPIVKLVVHDIKIFWGTTSTRWKYSNWNNWNQNDVHQNDQSWRCWGATFWRIISFWQAFNCSVNYINFVRWLYQLCEIKDNCVSANSIRRVFSLTLFQRWCNELLTPLIQAQELYNPVEHIFPWRTLLDTNHWSNIMHVFTAILILSLYTFKGYHM